MRPQLVLLATLVLLGGCATTPPEGQAYLTRADLQAMEERLHRDELAILAINTKLDGLKKLVSGPLPSVAPVWTPASTQALPSLAPPIAPGLPVYPHNPTEAGKVLFKANVDKLRKFKQSGQKREILNLMALVRDLPANGKYIVATPNKYQDDEYIAGVVKFNFMKALVEAGRTSWANVRDDTYSGHDIVVYATS